MLARQYDTTPILNAFAKLIPFVKAQEPNYYAEMSFTEMLCSDCALVKYKNHLLQVEFSKSNIGKLIGSNRWADGDETEYEYEDDQAEIDITSVSLCDIDPEYDTTRKIKTTKKFEYALELEISEYILNNE